MNDLVSAVSQALRELRSASPTMLLLRVVLAVAMLGCVLCCGNAYAWGWVLMAIGAVAVVMAGTIMPTVFLVGAVLLWLFTGSHAWPAIAGFTLAVALVHWAAVQCVRGPLQARVAPSAFAVRAWLAWAGCSLAGIAVLLGGNALGAHLPGGRVTVLVCGLVIAAVTFLVLIAFARFGRVDR